MAKGSLEVKIQARGLKRLQRTISNMGETLARQRLIPAITKEALRQLAISQGRVSVGESGQLRKNVQILETDVLFVRRSVFGKPIPTEIQGGFAFLQEYAAAHHEGKPASGTKWPNGGIPKYAELTLKENKSRYLRALGRALGLK